MSNKILQLKILDENNKTLFDKDKYMIPLYQRAFAWSEKEIEQLIDDIKDFEADHYYLGSLVVNLNKDGVYEVIDGQQRLTALFLLLDYVGDYNWGEGKLSYECRERSNFTLNCLAQLTNDSVEVYLANPEKIEQTLIAGRKIIGDKFSIDRIDKNKFIANLKKVILYRIEVPRHTDLNRYFEIMNVRGEQLEQHDILKAKLMEPLDAQSRNAFATVWDACRDMTGYVQMHFKKDDREMLFGDDWGYINIDKWNMVGASNDTDNDKASILDIINYSTVPTSDDGEDDDSARIRFDSIIGFTHFLLHVLKVFATSELDEGSYSIPELLDDKKLLEIFTSVIGKGNVNHRLITSKEFSLSFIKCLLKCRFLFDKYCVKREYKNDDTNGDWSLKELKVSGARSKKKPYYKDTYFGEYGEWEKTYAPRTRNNLMLQSCLRVSYTSPKIMHWITRLLKWVYNDDNINRLSQFEKDVERIAQEPVEDFLSKQDYRLGVNTQHIIFNYLDYILWRNSKADFTFEFRNSVEHWYPQHPSEQSFEKWNDVDRFGNLCIIQRNVNSKFSNLSPAAKKSTYLQMIEKGSLKLRLMSNMLHEGVDWRCEEVCGKHEKEMLNLLRKACGIELIP